MLPKVYIGMPITFADDHIALFTRVAEACRGKLEPVLPTDAEETFRWSEDIRNFTVDIASRNMVERDIGKIKACDGAMFFLPAASIGTAMEIVHAKLYGKPSLVAVPLSLLYHPWLRYHATEVVWSTDMFGRDLDYLVNRMKKLIAGK